MNSGFEDNTTTPLLPQNYEMVADESINVDNTANSLSYDESTNPYLFRQSILNAIARKNVLDRSKNKLLGTSNKEQRERQIRQVLNEVLSMPNLADYTVTKSISGAIGSTFNTYGQGLFGSRYNKETKGSFMDPLFRNKGGKTRRRRRKGHGRKSRKH